MIIVTHWRARYIMIGIASVGFALFIFYCAFKRLKARRLQQAATQTTDGASAASGSVECLAVSAGAPLGCSTAEASALGASAVVTGVPVAEAAAVEAAAGPAVVRVTEDVELKV